MFQPFRYTFFGSTRKLASDPKQYSSYPGCFHQCLFTAIFNSLQKNSKFCAVFEKRRQNFPITCTFCDVSFDPMFAFEFTMKRCLFTFLTEKFFLLLNHINFDVECNWDNMNSRMFKNRVFRQTIGFFRRRKPRSFSKPL